MTYYEGGTQYSYGQSHLWLTGHSTEEEKEGKEEELSFGESPTRSARRSGNGERGECQSISARRDMDEDGRRWTMSSRDDVVGVVGVSEREQRTLPSLRLSPPEDGPVELRTDPGSSLFDDNVGVCCVFLRFLSQGQSKIEALKDTEVTCN